MYITQVVMKKKHDNESQDLSNLTQNAAQNPTMGIHSVGLPHTHQLQPLSFAGLMAVNWREC